MRRGPSLAIVSLIGIATAACPNQLELKRKSETRYKIAEDAYARKDYATAVVELERALDLDKKNAAAHYLLALYYMINRSDLATAEKHLELAIEYHDGSFSKAKNALGNIWLNDGIATGGDAGMKRVDAAVALFEEALSDIHYYKESWAAEVNLGRALFHKGDLDGALVHFDRGLLIEPKNCNGYFYRGDVWKAKGDADKAARDYGTASSTCPAFTDALLKLGNVNLELKRLPEAAAAFAACITSAPGTKPADLCKDKLRLACLDSAASATPACSGK